MKQKFNVTGMTCAACSTHVDNAVKKLDGVKKVNVNLLTNSMSVELDETKISTKQIMDAVSQAGYQASLPQANLITQTKPVENEMAKLKTRVIWSFIFLVPLMYVSMGHMWNAPLPEFLAGHANAVSFGLTQFLLALPIVYLNQSYFIKGFKGLKNKTPNMDSLIAIGSLAALLYGIFAIYRMSYGLGIQDLTMVAMYHEDLYFETAATILSLITLGKYFESRSKGKTKEALEKLMDLSPKTALLVQNDTITEVPIEQIHVNDIVLIRPGSLISIDGIIIEGETAVDEAAITGESIPVEKGVGNNVIQATMNKTGAIKVKATSVGENTVFAEILKLVEQASATKAPIAKLADKVAGVFVPIVILIAIITAIAWLLLGKNFEFALGTAIGVLVISCPCALGLATPVAIMVGTGKGAENGILIKSGEALETTHSINTVVFDKTGTITMGKPVVTDCIALVDKQALYEITYALEIQSEHPLAEALVQYTQPHITKSLDVKQFQALLGKGVIGEINQHRYLAGNQRLMDEYNVNYDTYQSAIDTYSAQGKTVLLFAEEETLIGLFAIADVVKPTSKQAIEQLKKMNIEVIMLTGDNEKTAQGIARGLHLDKVIAQVLPADKEKVITQLKNEGKKVAMVGDGINDAVALVSADIGIAIGNGTDVAIESADIVLMKNDLLDVVSAIKLSKATITNIKENLFWAFFYNLLGIPLAAGVFYPLLGWRLSPMFAAAAMSFSSLFVVSNALRLKLFKVEKKENNHQKEEKKMSQIYEVSGMMCQNCVKHVSHALNEAGIMAQVDLATKLVTVTSDHQDQDVVAAIEKAGYKAEKK